MWKQADIMQFNLDCYPCIWLQKLKKMREELVTCGLWVEVKKLGISLLWRTANHRTTSSGGARHY